MKLLSPWLAVCLLSGLFTPAARLPRCCCAVAAAAENLECSMRQKGLIRANHRKSKDHVMMMVRGGSGGTCRQYDIVANMFLALTTGSSGWEKLGGLD
jgi:hypothetical protein